MSTFAENVLANINNEVTRLGLKPEIVSIATDIPLAALKRKLGGESDFTVGEIATLARVLKFDLASVFKAHQPQVEMKPCPDQSCTVEQHEWTAGDQDGPCVYHRFVHDTDSGEYFAEVQKWSGETWTVYGELAFMPVGVEGLEVLNGYHRDYSEGLRIAERLNGAELHRSTEPGEPDLAGCGGGL